MEAANELAPPVVAVMVVFDPGSWFDEVLEGLADQDYANLKCLFLIVGDPGDVPDRVRDRVPNAFVRAVGNVAGYGAVANEVLRLVEGDNGFFCFLHDDVALDPGAIRLLVEEMYRSNAGIVGPKLVSWEDPGVLQHVGMGVDRFGEIDSFVEEGEVDQEQHDAVRDVFALPSACMLIRADLFR
ncbi:MAG TPA: glycosyltransferase, partial [Ilumatobacteraceae bacterium]|nr:glycosyltransferase [Ilumatobacteraceae bacterium]